ncbi:MAG: hypothetical protein N2595_10235 [bacterium]|nr:hypothetical protein [bacterium]
MQGGEARWCDVGLPTVGAKPSLAHRVIEHLGSEDILLEKIAPRRMVEKALGKEEKEKSVEEI